MTNPFINMLGVVALGLSALATPAFAQGGMPDDEMFRRFPPPCLQAFDVPGVLVSRGYRNARVVDSLTVEKVQVIAANSTGQYLLTFNLCTQEIEDREAL